MSLPPSTIDDVIGEGGGGGGGGGARWQGALRAQHASHRAVRRRCCPVTKTRGTATTTVAMNTTVPVAGTANVQLYEVWSGGGFVGSAKLANPKLNVNLGLRSNTLISFLKVGGWMCVDVSVGVRGGCES